MWIIKVKYFLFVNTEIHLKITAIVSNLSEPVMISPCNKYCFEKEHLTFLF